MSLLHRALVAASRGVGGQQQVGVAGCHVSLMRSHTCLVTSVTRVPGPGPVHLVPGLLAPRARRAAAQPRLAPRRRHPRQHEVLPLRPPDRPLPERQGCGVRHCQLPADDQGNQQNNKRRLSECECVVAAARVVVGDEPRIRQGAGPAPRRPHDL